MDNRVFDIQQKLEKLFKENHISPQVACVAMAIASVKTIFKETRSDETADSAVINLKNMIDTTAKAFKREHSAF